MHTEYADRDNTIKLGQGSSHIASLIEGTAYSPSTTAQHVSVGHDRSALISCASHEDMQAQRASTNYLLGWERNELNLGTTSVPLVDCRGREVRVLAGGGTLAKLRCSLDSFINSGPVRLALTAGQ